MVFPHTQPATAAMQSIARVAYILIIQDGCNIVTELGHELMVATVGGTGNDLNNALRIGTTIVTAMACCNVAPPKGGSLRPSAVGF